MDEGTEIGLSGGEIVHQMMKATGYADFVISAAFQG